MAATRHSLPGSGTGATSLAGYAGVDHPSLELEFVNPGVIFYTHAKMKIHDVKMIGADCIVLQLTTDICDMLSCSVLFVSVPAAYMTCNVKPAGETTKYTVAGSHESGADVAMTPTKLIMDGFLSRAYIITFDVNGRPLRAFCKNQFSAEKGYLLGNALCEMTLLEKYNLPLKPYIMLKVKYVDHSMLSINQVLDVR